MIFSKNFNINYQIFAQRFRYYSEDFFRSSYRIITRKKFLQECPKEFLKEFCFIYFFNSILIFVSNNRNNIRDSIKNSSRFFQKKIKVKIFSSDFFMDFARASLKCAVQNIFKTSTNNFFRDDFIDFSGFSTKQSSRIFLTFQQCQIF